MVILPIIIRTMEVQVMTWFVPKLQTFSVQGPNSVRVRISLGTRAKCGI